MTDKPEISRNDQTAIAFLKKIMDRLDADRADYEARIARFQATLSSFNTVYSQANNISPYAHLTASQLHATASQQQAIAAQYGNHSHTTSIPGQLHGGIGVTVPQWEPYLTQAEYDTLRAWANGEDILIHLLTAER